MHRESQERRGQPAPDEVRGVRGSEGWYRVGGLTCQILCVIRGIQSCLICSLQFHMHTLFKSVFPLSKVYGKPDSSPGSF